MTMAFLDQPLALPTDAFQKKPVESMSMLIPPSDPSSPYCEHLKLFFFFDVFYYWSCLVRCETDFEKKLAQLDKNNTKEGRPKFYKLKVRGSI